MSFSRWIRTSFAILGLATLGSAAHGAPFISGTYYEENASNGCAGSINCSVLFSAIPEGKAVLLVRLTCSVRVSKAVRLLRVELGLSRPGNLPTRFQDLPFFDTLAANSLQRFYVVESDPHFLLGAGARPFVRVVTTGNALTNLDCHVAGQR